MLASSINMDSQHEQDGKIHPKRFALILLIVSMVMLFAGLTSAFIVRKAEGNWLNFDLPVHFIYSSIAVALSSLTMILAYRSAKKDELVITRIMLGLTFFAGLAFVYFQYLGFLDLADRGIYFSPDQGGTGNLVSGSFVIALIALHLLHLLGGLIFVGVVAIKSLLSQVHKKRTLSISMCNTYWHFVGILWLYLYLFLYFAPQF